MDLKELINLLTIKETEGNTNIPITGIQMDSRRIEKGNIFICVPGIEGFLADRHDFIEEAVSAGAVAIVVEKEMNNYPGVTKIRVKDARFAMAVMSAHFYNYPSRQLKLYGITGTNGKTTTSYILDTIFSNHKLNMGLMGNNGVKIKDKLYPVQINTHEPPALQKNLREMTDQEVDCCVMEVSSQGLDMGRVIGCHFKMGIFTNLTQDHLDYHKDFESYKEAKGLLFSRLGENSSNKNKSYAVLNADDPASVYFKKITSAEVITYGIEHPADVSARNISVGSGGISFTAETFRGEIDIHLKLIGLFNIYNTLAAIAAALLEDVPLESIRDSLTQIESVQGRMELVDAGQPFSVLVDYAHTPDALENVLRTLKEIAEGRIITVFGCGGDRDSDKRPKMGSIAGAFSDYVVVTSDNPRTEEPSKILTQIAEGINNSKYQCIVDRKAAIEMAIKMARPKDIVLIAGKGHETYQIIGDQTIHFGDKEAAAAILKTLS
ncbi:UDP-N-acetylmuramoyl-L-alanyl-D-glutamate--2,6-diaminopimelate ligase [Oceanobacillus neutriphilus]|uniref:UDP-N-acetylmuramoyl-L-alanyl-D-glutamate--2,6-diaminopimelate ligase n=1 Tax=Oceanobacillus neutriphilus TaxID=531815 RepID=A0ABQ2NW82_9BACI|nr:UDP-N-acetylmuramoyl-L-alanyl-D-glutamate--2,6-diaminopimelate ligase [Oceanobacillus neutriphilus]GGP12014.1 UDP-N-acetylmuramoyl-L-alanyl-D-glutamate--2,6-diaminopimelate ligase [Oceanobacillus neutriphilus]